MEKVGVITGITGQDGSYLAELLLSKGYSVVGFVRRTSSPNIDRISHILGNDKLSLVQVDITDSSSIISGLAPLKKYSRIEIYNLAAQSHVHTSFLQPEYTANANALGPLRILEAVRTLEISEKTRVYQASTSELYGKVVETPQRETTPFYPRSPYGVSKLYAFWIIKNYRESYGMFACNGILFNHESERRGEEFITRKISKGVARIEQDESFVLRIGNVDAKRDWGYAPDYVEGMWRLLQQETPQDVVLATGELHSVREFLEEAFHITNRQIRWEGAGVNEKGYDKTTGRLLVEIDPAYYRPCEVDLLVGDASLARTFLNWTAKTPFKELVSKMVKNDLLKETRSV